MADDGAPELDDDLLWPAEVAARFGVTTSTLRSWAADGRLPWRRTRGGHRRYLAADVDRLLATFQASDDLGPGPARLLPPEPPDQP